MKIRERDFMNNGLFSGYEEIGHSATSILAMLGSLVGMLVLGMPLDLVFGAHIGMSAIIGAVLGAIIGGILPNLSRLYAGRGIPSELLDEARHYFYLSKEDRAVYPSGIIEAMKTPGLNYNQRWDLEDSLRKLREEIQDRNKARGGVPDLSDIIERLHDARENVAIETNTYKEYL